MDFSHDERTRAVVDQVEAMLRDQVTPRDPDWQAAFAADPRAEPAFLDGLRATARDLGLWNLGLPHLDPEEPGTRLSNLAFAPVAEAMGRIAWSPAVFNCQAPDIPNMEALQLYATPAQKRRWLSPLLEGACRSAFAMSEPDVASSDAANIATRIARDGDDYVITGRKWYISGASHPLCRFLLAVGVTDPAATRGRRHSVVIVPRDASGLSIVRDLTVFGDRDGVGGHSELLFDRVRVPRENLLGQEGEGLAIAQARLGPARIHHCMRAIGSCEVLLALMLDRGRTRVAFSRPVGEYGALQEWVALSRLEIEQARLMVCRTAWRLDRGDDVRQDISLIKIGVARTYQAIADRAVQAFGAAGVSADTPIAQAFVRARALRIYDGPDEVHIRTVHRLEAARAHQAGTSPVADGRETRTAGGD